MMRVLIFSVLSSVGLVAATGTKAITAATHAGHVDGGMWIPLGIYASTLVVAVGLSWRMGRAWQALSDKVDRAVGPQPPTGE